MRTLAIPPLVVACVMLASHSLARAEQTNADQPRQFEVIGNPAFSLPDGRTVPLFITAATAESPLSGPANVNQDEILTSVAAEGAELRKGVEVSKLMLASKMLFSFRVKGEEAENMLLVTAHPQKRPGRKKIFKNPVTFTPGSLTRLADVIGKFGQPTETQFWSSEPAKDLGLDGLVHWWGEVGVSASTDGAITHVLVRKVVKRK